MKRGLVDLDSDLRFAESMTRMLRAGCAEILVCTEGARLGEPSTLKALLSLRQFRVRVVVSTFDDAKHAALGGRSHPREVVRGIARASAAGVHVDVVLPIAETLGTIAGRLHGLAKAAPKVKRFLHVAVPDALTPRDPIAIAGEIEEARAVAAELGVALEMDRDTHVDTELEAVLGGIKPVIRLSTEAGDEAELIAGYERFGLVGCSAEGVFINADGTHSRKMRLVYVAKTLAYAEHVRAVEAKTFVPYTSLEQRAEEYRDLGVALGYPRCCVDAYVARVVLDPESEMGGLNLTEPYVVARGGWCDAPAWQLNHLLFETGSASISFTPCSYQCPVALEYASRVLERVREVAPQSEPSLRRRLSVDLVVDRYGARMPVAIEGTTITAAFPRRTKSGGWVHRLDQELARSLVGKTIGPDGRVLVDEAYPPIVLRFGTDPAREAAARLSRGDLVGALSLIRSAGAVPAPIAQLFEHAEGRRRGSRRAAPSEEQPQNEAWSRLWAGDVEGARASAGEDVLIIEAVASVLEGASLEALALFERLPAVRPAVALHRVHALLQLGRTQAAERALADLVDGESFGRRVLDALASLRTSPFGRHTVRSWSARARASHTQFNGLFAVELPALVGVAELDRCCRSFAALDAMLVGLLRKMAGNLGRSVTFAERGSDGERRWVRVELPKTSRQEAIDALFSIREVGVEGAEQALASVLLRHPRSVQAHTYRGELHLWTGDYDEAARSFARALLIEPTRWSEIGLVASATLAGFPQAARAIAWIAERHFPPVAGGTLPVYRGVLRRRLGDPRAIDDLARAVKAKPSRVGARIELVLALRADGQATGEHVEQLVQDASPLLIDMADASGLDWRRDRTLLVCDAVLERALSAMRGNRSSAIVTWFDRDGALRVLESRQILADNARRLLDVRAPNDVTPAASDARYEAR